MPEPSSPATPAPRLVILLNTVSNVAPEAALVALRYALTAAAMDVAVEIHAVSQSVVLFRRDAAEPAVLNQIRQAAAMGAQLFVCPVALTEQGLRVEDLIDEVDGVRGAASLLVAGLEPGARFMVF